MVMTSNWSPPCLDLHGNRVECHVTYSEVCVMVMNVGGVVFVAVC